ncbi:TetR/AcrR family transcriptional regulator [Sinorhizobium sp. BG8]|uniref:TetR/AcrR family transcriptional regulator n=1 Tax=Sinorhizobium sp. BG8 TaxID=2613773 RepID=UPI00193EBA32|nr:TetR/AcrR family transcriptional regulator [Sinorhizobium sp. BG8]QRM57491.1 TetR/AcrR family transcriptional regulator [Sinorhizobium sp. BG8]
MTDKKQAGVRAQRKAERPGEILDAAFEEFVENGYAATRVEDIAARIGVTKGTVYFYFETKEILFEEMLRHISVPFSDLKQELGTLTGSYQEKIKAFARLIYDRISTDRNSRELLRFIIAEGARFPQAADRHYEEHIVPMFDAARELLEAGVAAGELRNSPVVRIPEIAFSPTMLLMVWQMIFSDRRPHDVEAFIDAHLDLMMNGLVARN